MRWEWDGEGDLNAASRQTPKSDFPFHPSTAIEGGKGGERALHRDNPARSTDVRWPFREGTLAQLLRLLRIPRHS